MKREKEEKKSQCCDLMKKPWDLLPPNICYCHSHVEVHNVISEILITKKLFQYLKAGWERRKVEAFQRYHRAGGREERREEAGGAGY